MKTGICFDRDEKTPDVGSTDGLAKLIKSEVDEKQKSAGKIKTPETKAQPTPAAHASTAP